MFYNKSGEDISVWDGDPRPLSVPITPSEVAIAVSSLNNGRAAGPDDLHGELYKYGSEMLHSELSGIFNSIFSSINQFLI